MTNSTIVDTDILIDAGRGVLEAVKCLQNLKASSGLAISIITQMELMVGCANKAELQTLENFLKQFYIIKIDQAVSDTAVDLLRSYRLSHGLLIADKLRSSYSNSVELPVDHKKPTGLQIYSRFKPIAISTTR